MSKELEQKLDAALDAIDQQRVDIDELKAQVAKYAESVSSIRIAAEPQAKKVLQDPGVVEVKDAEGKKVKVRFALLKFAVNDGAGATVKYIAEDVAKNAALLQSLYEKHPTAFRRAK